MANQVASATIVAAATLAATSKDHDAVSAAILGAALLTLIPPVVTHTVKQAPTPVSTVVLPLRVIPVAVLQQSLGKPTRRNG